MNKHLLWFSLLVCHVSYAEPTVNIKTEYYSIKGNTPQAIRNDMNKKRPHDYDAYTYWHVKWHFNMSQDQDEEYCEISTVDVNLDVTFTLPRLKRFATDEIEELWNDYYTALVDHEHQHKDIAVEAAEAIEEALNELEGEEDCEQLEEVANATAYEIVDEYKEKQVEFDDDTNHGMDDGAVFP